MNRSDRYNDAGQAFPIYITVVAGLLFLAFAYLAVGQAAVNRSGAQTAADAAALAAAQDTRDQLAGKWVEDVLDPTKWKEIFDGAGAGNSCWRAVQFAARNDAHAQCAHPEPLRYAVDVQANKPVGDSVVPGTEHMKSKASATAVIEPLCTFDLPDGNSGKGALPQLTCRDRNWDLNPDDLTDLPKPQDLFDVHLANDER
ncbi:pilus assembly protein TadG-related protein [Streptomyces sp. NPDC050743]|uniref:pilus assembly protein TadG-related protein n=1 Tax=Streptomyces sp. NPDC050743 TaxID=3365634 RepID=UPI00378B35FC